MPLEATLLLFLGTPQSTIPRDVSLDVNLSPKRLLLKIIHPLKNILIQGFKPLQKWISYGYLKAAFTQEHDTIASNTIFIVWNSYCECFLILFLTAQLEELNNQHSGRIELLIDNIHHYFIKVSEKNIGFVKSQEKLLCYIIQESCLIQDHGSLNNSPLCPRDYWRWRILLQRREPTFILMPK